MDPSESAAPSDRNRPGDEPVRLRPDGRGSSTVGDMTTPSERLRPVPVTVFAVVTLLIWTNRIWLAWTNDEDTVAQKLVWSTPITLFVIAAAVLLMMILRRRSDAPVFAPLVRVFAGGTIVYWVVRMVLILGKDHTIGFKAVHSALAIVSAAFAVGAWRAVDTAARGDAPSRDGGHRRVAG